MAHVVTERCVDCRYTDCCAVCPVECFWEVEKPAMLVIDPATCIDCAMCIPECPIYAIYPDKEVPDPYKEWIQKNKDLTPKGTHITAKKDALPSAVPLDEIHNRERTKGLKVSDPSAVAAEPAAAAPAAAAVQEVQAASAPAPSGAPAAEAEEGAPVVIPRGTPRPPIAIRRGARVKIYGREGTVQEVREGSFGSFIDARILFDADEKPVWYIYSTLRTLKEKGELEILDPGPPPGFLRRLFGG